MEKTKTTKEKRDKFQKIKIIIKILALIVFISFLVDYVKTAYSFLNVDEKRIKEQKEMFYCLNKIEEDLFNINEKIDWNNLTNDINLLYNNVNQELKQQNITNREDFSEEKKINIEALNNSIEVSATAYNMGKITSTGTKVRPGVIAVSRDLLKDVEYGSVVWVYVKKENGSFYKYGEYTVEDTMHKRWKKCCDIYMPTKREALEFGRKRMWLVKK